VGDAQYGILNISQPYRPPWTLTGIALYCSTSTPACLHGTPPRLLKPGVPHSRCDSESAVTLA
jgi:hypothetical protein